MTIDAFATATELLAALRTKQVSTVELLEFHIRRIARHNPALNAIVEPDFDRARDEATTADARRQSGAGTIGLAHCRVANAASSRPTPRAAYACAGCPPC